MRLVERKTESGREDEGGGGERLHQSVEQHLTPQFVSDVEHWLL